MRGNHHDSPHAYSGFGIVQRQESCPLAGCPTLAEDWPNYNDPRTGEARPVPAAQAVSAVAKVPAQLGGFCDSRNSYSLRDAALALDAIVLIAEPLDSVSFALEATVKVFLLGAVRGGHAVDLGVGPLGGGVEPLLGFANVAH